MSRYGAGRFLAWLLAFLLLPFPRGFPGNERPAQGKMRALLIGCDHFLTQEDTISAAEHNIAMLSDVLLQDDRRYALIRSCSSSIGSVSEFESAVTEAFRNAGPEDVSLLYIATHGLFEPEAGVDSAALLLSDGEREERLDAQTMQAILDQVSGKKVLILDACNAGAMIGKGLSGGEGRSFFTGPDYKVLCSAGGSEASWYFQGAQDAAATGASYFAAVLCHGLGLQGEFAADINADGRVTLSEMHTFLWDNYAASTPQVYPQGDEEFVLFSYDLEHAPPLEKAVTDLTFDDTLLTAGHSEVTFSFTVQRQTELYYQIIYHQDGQWQFAQAQHYLDGEQLDGTVLPGRKKRTLSLNTSGQDASGYAMIQLITLEEGQPVFQGARLLCVQPEAGPVALRVLTAPAFAPGEGEEITILVEHDVPCGMTVNILSDRGKVVRRLAYETPSRPQQLTPAGSTFYWDGKLNNGEPAPAGEYTAQVRVRLGGESYDARSAPFRLTGRNESIE